MQTTENATASASAEANNSTTTNVYLQQGYYIVEQGDKLTDISRKVYGTEDMVSQICQKNNIGKQGDHICAGDKLPPALKGQVLPTDDRNNNTADKGGVHATERLEEKDIIEQVGKVDGKATTTDAAQSEQKIAKGKLRSISVNNPFLQ